MRTFVLDAETFYSKEYSLRNLTPAEYILNPQFELIGCAVKELSKKEFWIEGPDMEGFLRNLDPEETTVISHNQLFDACIWSYRYGWVPKLLVDTLGMARAMLNLKSNSLFSVAKFLHLPEEKGNEVQQAIGMRLANLQANPMFYRKYQDYALKDARLCEGIYARLAKGFPDDEFFIQDLVLRAAVEPILHADTRLLASHLDELRKKKARLLRECNYDRANLMSTPQFQAALEELGVMVQTKISPSGRQVPAFAKTDPFMETLQEYQDGPNDDINYRVQVLASARLAHKSTIEETRAERFLSIAQLPWGSHQPLLPVPLRYGGAHTHRLSGEWRMNLQNLPRDRRKSSLRTALVAPKGFKILAADLSQIEARIVACLSGQDTLIESFRNGEDVYASFASMLFGGSINKRTHPGERFIGKTCLAAGTLVYTDRGLVPIEAVNLTDHVWDGEQWVSHDGVIQNGLKPTLQLCGISLTPDHLVWSGIVWKRADLLVIENDILRQALAFAAANLPSPDILGVKGGKDSQDSLYNVIVDDQSMWLTRIISGISKVRDVTFALNKLRCKNVGGNTPTSCRMTNIVDVSLTGWPQQLDGAIDRKTSVINTTVRAAFTSLKNGVKTVQRSFDMFKHFQVGMTPAWISTVSTTIEDMNPVMFVSAPPVKICSTGAKFTNLNNELGNLKPVYDITNAGPKHRFLIHTDRGPLLVSNCILGLGYGCGAQRFFTMVTSQARQYNINITGLFDADIAQKAVTFYRNTFPCIKSSWDRLETLRIRVLNNTRSPGHSEFGPVEISTGRIRLPNGMYLRYEIPDQSLYGAKMLENITQALARIVIMDAALRLEEQGYRFVLQAHDELAFVVRDEDVEEAKKIILHEMLQPPGWMLDLPLAAEIGVGQNYGECK